MEFQEKAKNYLANNLLPIGAVVIAVISTYFSVGDNSEDIVELQNENKKIYQHVNVRMKTFYDWRDEHMEKQKEMEREYTRVIIKMDDQIHSLERELEETATKLDGVKTELDDYKERVKYLERKK